MFKLYNIYTPGVTLPKFIGNTCFCAMCVCVLCTVLQDPRNSSSLCRTLIQTNVYIDVCRKGVWLDTRTRVKIVRFRNLINNFNRKYKMFPLSELIFHTRSLCMSHVLPYNLQFFFVVVDKFKRIPFDLFCYAIYVLEWSKKNDFCFLCCWHCTLPIPTD